MATVPDLILGIVICSMRCDEFLPFVNSKKCERELARLGQRIQQETKKKYFSLLDKFGLFRQYLAEGTVSPNYWDETDGESAGSGSHWLHNVEITLRSELGYTTEDIEEGPLSKALLDCFKLAESKGAIRLMTDEELAQGEANGAALEAQLRGLAMPPIQPVVDLESQASSFARSIMDQVRPK